MHNKIELSIVSQIETIINTIPFNIKTSCRLTNMEVSITKLSENGQVVIPTEIRKDAGLKPATKFLVFNEGGNILLKMIKKEALVKDIQLIESINKSEEQISEGKSVKVNTSMSDEDIDDLLMS